MRNLVIITADDLSYYACWLGHAPAVEALAAEGHSFAHGHANIAICEPSRAVMMTGLYPHNNGSLDFRPIQREPTTLIEVLARHGYYCALIGKEFHYRPSDKYPCNEVTTWREMGGRHSANFKQAAARAIFNARSQKRPYCLLINFINPHRPFYRSGNVPREVPPFLPDQSRSQLGHYYETVSRCDSDLRSTLEAVKKDNTIIVFTSDHGMSFPFAKGNCYRHSTNVPLIYWCPELIQPCRDHRHLVSAVDLMPTLLEALQLPAVAVDGRSYWPLLRGEEMAGWDVVYTQMNKLMYGPQIPMRSVLTRRHHYIANFFSKYPAIFVDGWDWREMLRAMQKSPRRKAYMFRPEEEFYDLSLDPYELHKIRSETAQKIRLRQLLLDYMKSFRDPLLGKYQKLMKNRIGFN